MSINGARTWVVTSTNTGTAGSFTWNGGHCATCGANYLGTHSCGREDILRRIADLYRLLDAVSQPKQVDQTQFCPCRPENGGSGVCGCVLGGPKVT